MAAGKDVPTWARIPDAGPIADVLRSRTEWLDALSRGSLSARKQALRDLADDGRTEDRIRQGYTGRAAIELLQNAHDAMADSHTVGAVRFVVTPRALLVANEGLPFDAERVGSICRLGSSSKSRASGHHLIGYKGIGFTSVFEVSDRPQILSLNVGFVFDRAAAADLVREKLGDGLDGPIPARYFPMPVGSDDIGDDEEVVASLFGHGAVTVVRLPFRSDIIPEAVHAAVGDTLVAETLLFMPTIRTLSLEAPGKRLDFTRRDGSRSGIGRIVHVEQATGEGMSWLLATGSVGLDHKLVSRLDDELWRDVAKLNVAAAIPWSERGPQIEPQPSRIHSYFPTDDHLGRCILIHGDFYLDSTRRHVELKGQGGEISRVAAEGAGELAGRLAESVAKWGGRVMGSFVRAGNESDAGTLIGEKIEAALAKRSVARRFGSGKLARPDALGRLGLVLDVAVVKRLATAIVHSDDVLHPGDDVGGVAGLFDRLGCHQLEPQDVAKQIDLARTSEDYGTALAMMASWLDTTGWKKSSVVQTLCERPVVQDEDGTWRKPSEVEWRTEDAPELPSGLRRLQVRLPPAGRARQFFDALQISRLDPSTALQRLLDALASHKFGRNHEERLRALELAYQIWKVQPRVLTSRQGQVGSIEVLARTNRARVERSWRRADTTYFGADWLDDGTLEALYAPLGQPEFLSDPFVGTPPERRKRREFYEALGVAAAPRRVQIGWPHAKRLDEWRSGAGRASAWECANVHPAVERRIEGWMMDRLDDVLHHAVDPDRAAALAHGLVLLGEPYGPEARVSCQHSAHGGQAQPKSVIGYQRWRLTTTAWVPVTNDPSGAMLQIPSRAWRGLPARSPWLLVPRARLRPSDAEALDLVAAERPGARPIEDALVALSNSSPDLAMSLSDVPNTAEWLARRLERILVHGERRETSSPPLATEGAEGWRWSTNAVVPNLPGLPHLPGLDLLPPGRWSGLRRAYGLRSARDVVGAEWKAGRRETRDLLLPSEIRVLLLALLLRRGAESERTASRLARLLERPVAWLKLSWVYESQRHDAADARFVFELRRDAKSRVVGAELIWTADQRPDSVELAAAFAEYLELQDDDSEIALFLTDPSRLISSRGITAFEIDDADRILRSNRWFRQLREQLPPAEPPEPDERLDPGDWEAPADKGTTAGPKQVDKEYIDPSNVAFGPASKVAAQDRLKGRSVSATKSSGASPVHRSRPLPAPREEEVVATAASGKKTEETAIEIVSRFGRGLSSVAEVIDVQDQNLGWDLEFHMTDGSMIPVEVKGSSGSGPFVLTGNEWNAARQHQEYVLYHVVDLTTPGRTRMRVYRGLSDRLTEDMVHAAGWAVTGWRSLEPEEIPVTIPGSGEEPIRAEQADR